MSSPVQKVYSWKYKNEGSADITGFGALAISGWERDPERGLVLLGQQPKAETEAADLIVANGPSDVAQDKYGTCWAPDLAWISLKDGEAPEHGDAVGATDGEAEATTSGDTFTVLGSVDDQATPERVLVYRSGGGGGGSKIRTGRVKGFYDGAVGELEYQVPTVANEQNNINKLSSAGYESVQIEVYVMVPFSHPEPGEGEPDPPPLTPQEKRRKVEVEWTQDDVDAYGELSAEEQALVPEPIVGQHKFEYWEYDLPDDLIRNAIVKGLKNEKGEWEAFIISPSALPMAEAP